MASSAIDTPWVTLYYGTDLRWYAGATPLVITSAANDLAVLRHKRANGVFTFQLYAAFGAGLVAAALAAGAGQWKFELPRMPYIGIPWALEAQALDVSAASEQRLPLSAQSISKAAADAGGVPISYVGSTLALSRTAPFTWDLGDALFTCGSIEGFEN